MASTPNDVRVITTFEKDNILAGVFNTLHETGKGIYEQNINEELLGWLLAEVPSYSIEEAQARIYENIIGKSSWFWEENFSVFNNYYNNLDLNYKNLLSYINTPSPGLIRNNADELTYPLHIIIRYEIEKALINNEINTKDLPEISAVCKNFCKLQNSRI